jgi:hypothetical protein
VLDGKAVTRTTALHFWEYDTRRFAGAKPQPYLDPELQKGTTPLVKLAGGKATRDFNNWRQPAVTDADYLGLRAIIEGRHKPVIHDQKGGAPKRELFDLDTDPAEKTDLAAQQPGVVEKLQANLRAWQDSVLKSLTGADYRK